MPTIICCSCCLTDYFSNTQILPLLLSCLPRFQDASYNPADVSSPTSHGLSWPLTFSFFINLEGLILTLSIPIGQEGCMDPGCLLDWSRPKSWLGLFETKGNTEIVPEVLEPFFFKWGKHVNSDIAVLAFVSNIWKNSPFHLQVLTLYIILGLNDDWIFLFFNLIF